MVTTHSSTDGAVTLSLLQAQRLGGGGDAGGVDRGGEENKDGRELHFVYLGCWQKCLRKKKIVCYAQ